jgi:glutaredoxin 3
MDLKSLIKENKVVLIGYTDCPYTNESARTLDSLSIAYKRINLKKNDPLHNELAKDTNRLTTPYLYIDGKFVGAESDLDTLLNTRKLYDILNKANVKYELPVQGEQQKIETA